MIQAAIFDLNGTVLSDEDEYGLAFKKVLSTLGVKTDEKYPQISGIGVEENWPHLIRKYDIKTDKSKEELAKETQDEYIKLLDRVELKNGFKEFVEKLKGRDIRVALATSNNWSIVEVIYDKFGLDKYFEVTTTCEEVHMTKPNPEIFLKTSAKMDLMPNECVVFEDAEAGIKAAREAGMKSVGVARNTEYQEKLNTADHVIYKDYVELDIDLVLNL